MRFFLVAALLTFAAGLAAADEAKPAAGAEPAAAAVAVPKKTAAKPKKKAAAKPKKKKAPEPESRYKSRTLSEGSERHYRFDAHGNPVGVGAKKKAAAKPKKTVSDAEDAGLGDAPACSDGESCSEKPGSPDADAL